MMMMSVLLMSSFLRTQSPAPAACCAVTETRAACCCGPSCSCESCQCGDSCGVCCGAGGCRPAEELKAAPGPAGDENC